MEGGGGYNRSEGKCFCERRRWRCGWRSETTRFVRRSRGRTRRWFGRAAELARGCGVSARKGGGDASAAAILEPITQRSFSALVSAVSEAEAIQMASSG
jgi:transposase